MKFINPFKKKDYQIICSSKTPYFVGIDEEDEGKYFATNTENWKCCVDKEESVPVKLSYGSDGVFYMDLFLPDKSVIEAIRNQTSDYILDLWLFLDDEEFFIVFPEWFNATSHSKYGIIQYKVAFRRFSFHSKEKALANKYSPQEIEKLAIETLSKHNIVEIQPMIIKGEETEQCAEISVLTPTAPMISKAISALRKEIDRFT